MLNHRYKKMAGTAAVFLSEDYAGASPVERDGMVWSAADLHLDQLTSLRQRKPAMATVLSLEGLEDYDMPDSGDVRAVESIGSDFVYFAPSHAWIQLAE